MEYPDTCIRGIPNKSFMENDYPNAELFKQFDENPERTDDYNEISINWSDDEGAIRTIMNQRKKDSEEYQFKIGGAVLSKKELDRLCRRPLVKNALNYERRKIPGNKYHGNILLKRDTTKSMRNMIASGLAMCVDNVIFRE